MTEHDLLDPIDAYAQLGQIKLGDTDLEGVLDRIAHLARRSIPGADQVSVTLLRGGGARTAAFTGDLAVRLDESQYQVGHGPCLAAAASGVTFSLPDMTAEERWPELAGKAVSVGCHSSLSIGLPVQEQVAGALNVYAAKPHAFDDDAIGVAETFAGYAAVALSNAHLYDTTARLAQHLQRAMESRAVIEQAKGVIMAGHRCGPDEAFRILVKLSQDSNRKLRDVAAALVARAGNTSS